MASVLISVVAAITWRQTASTGSWRPWFRWMLLALAGKAIIYSILVNIHPGLRNDILPWIDLAYLSVMMLAVIETHALLTWVLRAGERLALSALLGLFSILVGCWTAGYWAGDDLAMYSQIRLAAQMAMFVFVAFALLWNSSTDPKGQSKLVSEHALIFSLFLGNYCWGNLCRPETAEGWAIANRVYSMLQLATLCLWAFRGFYKRTQPLYLAGQSKRDFLDQP